jgi:hypothetical protein
MRRERPEFFRIRISATVAPNWREEVPEVGRSGSSVARAFSYIPVRRGKVANALRNDHAEICQYISNLVGVASPSARARSD